MNEPDYTLEIEDVIRLGIEQRLFDLNVSLPASVVKFDKAKQRATVQVDIQRRYSPEKIVSLPAILNVPVVFPRAGAWSITGPVRPGDTGQLIFSQRSLDVWKQKGGQVDPKDPRKFHLSDAVFYPGLSPESKKLDIVSDTNLRFQNGTTRFELTEDGKMRLEKVGGDEFLDLMSQTLAKLITLTDKLSTDTTNTMLGPMKLNFFTDYATLKSDMTELKGKLDAIKG